MTPARGFIDVGGRTVHYRRAGSGPALVLLHGSPNSSLALEPLIAVLSRRFDCIAFDTPGNGDSDALAHPAPMTEDYAEGLLETVDAFGLKRFSLYGFHTGAGTAAEFAARWPERVAGIVLDGVAAWTAQEKAGMLDGYLPPFLPQWGGAHLAWLWSRVVEQTMFFPWHRPSAATRMNYDMPPVETLQRTAMEFLRSGDNYRKPYAAALAGDGAARIQRLKKPALVTAHPMDPIAGHLDRLSGFGDQVTVRKETLTDKSEIWNMFSDFLAKHPGDATPAPPKTAGRRAYAGSASRRMALRKALATAHGRPLVLLHDAGGSSALFDEALDHIAERHPVFAFDLPGHGESAGLTFSSIIDAADAVGDALADLGVADAAAAGFGLGGLVACELRRRGAAGKAALIGAPRAKSAPPPDLSPRMDGGHLLAAWHFVRLRTLYLDWSRRDHAGIAWTTPELDCVFIHRRAVDLLKCDNRHAEAFAAEESAGALGAYADALFLPECDPSGLALVAPGGKPDMPRAPLSGPPAAWGPPLAAFGG